MARVVHFDIEADDPERAQAFYREVFGWAFKRWDGPMEYWLISTGAADEPGIDGGLSRRDGPTPEVETPSAAFTCTIAVDGLDDVVASVRDHGGEVLRETMEIPGVGRMSPCSDTEGNRFLVLEGGYGEAD